MGAIIGIAVAYLLILAGVFFFQRSLMYYPPKDQPDLSAYPGLGLEAVTLTTADGLDLKAWYRPADRPELPTVVYFHGNAGHIGDRVPKYRPFMEAGYGALLVEYRGYGGNPGKPTEAGLTADAQAAMAFALAQGIEPGRIVVHGESLGTGLAVKMAAAHPVAAVVLEAPPGSIAEVAQAHYWYLPAKWLTLDRWDVFPLLEQVKAPILLLHGDADRTVPQTLRSAPLRGYTGSEAGDFSSRVAATPTCWTIPRWKLGFLISSASMPWRSDRHRKTLASNFT